MSGGRVIHSHRFAALWRADPRLINEQTPFVSKDIGLNVRSARANDLAGYADYSTVDELLRDTAQSFANNTVAPSLDLLLKEFRYDPRTLLTPEETAKLLGNTLADTLRDTKVGALPALTVAGVTRYPADSIAHGTIPPEILEAREVALVTGTLMHNVHSLSASGVLVSVRARRRPQSLTVTSDSVLAYLEDKLASYVTPVDWWRLRWRYRDPVYTATHVSKLCHLPEDNLEEILHQRRDPYGFANGELIVPKHVVDRMMAESGRLSHQQIAQIFGVDTEQAQSWIEKNAFCTDHEANKKLCPARECVKGHILRQRLHDTVDPEEWLDTTLDGGVTPLGSTYLELDVQEASLTVMATKCTTGVLPAVRLPFSKEGIAIARPEAMRFLQSADVF